MNAEGEVVGLVQKNSDKESTSSYAIGIGYAKSLSITALSANDFTLNTIGIKKDCRKTESQALVYLLYVFFQPVKRRIPEPAERICPAISEKTVKVIPAVPFVT